MVHISLPTNLRFRTLTYGMMRLKKIICNSNIQLCLSSCILYYFDSVSEFSSYIFLFGVVNSLFNLLNFSIRRNGSNIQYFNQKWTTRSKHPYLHIWYVQHCKYQQAQFKNPDYMLHQCLLSQQHGTCSYDLCRWHEHSPQLSPTKDVMFRCNPLSWRERVREPYLNWSFTHSLIIYYPTWLTDVSWKLAVKCKYRQGTRTWWNKKGSYAFSTILLWMTVQVRWNITVHTFKYLPPRYIGDLKHDITRWQGLDTWRDRISNKRVGTDIFPFPTTNQFYSSNRVITFSGGNWNKLQNSLSWMPSRVLYMNESDSLVCLFLPSAEFLLWASLKVSPPFLDSENVTKIFRRMNHMISY